MTDKVLGKIKSVAFGRGGYDDAMIGVSFSFAIGIWSSSDFWGFWTTKRTAGSKWSESDRREELGDIVLRIAGLLDDAKVNRLEDLAGKPIEAEFEQRVLKSWRILTEVI